MFFRTRINGHRAMSMEKEGLSQHTETGQATAILVNTGLTDKIQYFKPGASRDVGHKSKERDFCHIPSNLHILQRALRDIR